MNHPAILAAGKAFRAWLNQAYIDGLLGSITPKDLRVFAADFDSRLEDQARAFDAMKSGTEVSMGALECEMTKGLMIALKTYDLTRNKLRADSTFREHMKPHLERRLF